MKNISLFLIVFFACSSLFYSCSANKQTVPVLEEGDQVANEEIVFTEKKVAATSNGKPTEYKYVLKNKVIAKEFLDENGDPSA